MFYLYLNFILSIEEIFLNDLKEYNFNNNNINNFILNNKYVYCFLSTLNFSNSIINYYFNEIENLTLKINNFGFLIIGNKIQIKNHNSNIKIIVFESGLCQEYGYYINSLSELNIYSYETTRQICYFFNPNLKGKIKINFNNYNQKSNLFLINSTSLKYLNQIKNEENFEISKISFLLHYMDYLDSSNITLSINNNFNTQIDFLPFFNKDNNSNYLPKNLIFNYQNIQIKNNNNFNIYIYLLIIIIIIILLIFKFLKINKNKIQNIYI